MKTKSKLIVAALCMAVISCTIDEVQEQETPQAGLEQEQSEQQDGSIIPGEYIIVFKEDTDKALSYAPTKRGGAPELAKIKQDFTGKSLNLLSRVSKSESNLNFVYTSVIQGFAAKGLTKADVEELKKDDRVAYIEPNRVFDPELPRPSTADGYDAIPGSAVGKNAGLTSRGDEVLPSGDFLPWGVDNVGRADNTGTNRYCFVMDSGIAPHSDLTIDTGLSSSMIAGENWVDLNGHGTHVAGTIGAKSNGSGVIGVAYGTTLVAVKVLGGTGGTGSDASTIAGCDYVYNNAIAGDVFNYSVGYRSRYTSTAVDNVFKRMDDRCYGALAAGNSNDNTLYYSPQRITTSQTWMVGNMTRSLGSAGSSNYGASVDRWAPGTDIWSTWLGGNFNKISGTSMASPHVAGILLVRGNNSVGSTGSISKGGFSAPMAIK